MRRWRTRTCTVLVLSNESLLEETSRFLKACDMEKAIDCLRTTAWGSRPLRCPLTNQNCQKSSGNFHASSTWPAGMSVRPSVVPQEEREREREREREWNEGNKTGDYEYVHEFQASDVRLYMLYKNSTRNQCILLMLYQNSYNAVVRVKLQNSNINGMNQMKEPERSRTVWSEHCLYWMLIKTAENLSVCE